jgi:hypothetical protein
MTETSFYMPKIQGVECPVYQPVGVVGGTTDASRIGVGNHDFPEGPGVLVTLSDKDGNRLIALMSPEKAKHFAAMLNSAVKTGLRKRGRMS